MSDIREGVSFSPFLYSRQIFPQWKKFDFFKEFCKKQIKRWFIFLHAEGKLWHRPFEKLELFRGSPRKISNPISLVFPTTDWQRWMYVQKAFMADFSKGAKNVVGLLFEIISLTAISIASYLIAFIWYQSRVGIQGGMYPLVDVWSAKSWRKI